MDWADSPVSTLDPPSRPHSVQILDLLFNNTRSMLMLYNAESFVNTTCVQTSILLVSVTQQVHTVSAAQLSKRAGRSLCP